MAELLKTLYLHGGPLHGTLKSVPASWLDRDVLTFPLPGPTPLPPFVWRNLAGEVVDRGGSWHTANYRRVVRRYPFSMTPGGSDYVRVEWHWIAVDWSEEAKG